MAKPNTEVVTVTRTTLRKVVETGFLSVTWLALGLYLEIFGPTLKDLKIKTNSSYEDVAGAVSARSIGLFAGCIVGGVLVDKFGSLCHLFIALCLDIAAVATVAVPWSPGIEILTVCCAVGGAVETVINIAGQTLILNIWKEKSAAFMIFLHAGYGIGSFIVPLYTNPFLAVPVPTDATNLTTFAANNQSDIVVQNSVTETYSKNQTGSVEPNEYLKESRIEYPYAISAALVVLVSIVFYYYQFQESFTRARVSAQDVNSKINEASNNSVPNAPLRDSDGIRSRSLREMFNPASCAGGRLWYGIQLFLVLFLYMGNAHGGERMIADFIRSYSIDQLGFSNSDASYLNTSFWISFAVGRFSFFGIASLIGIRKLVLLETGGIAITTVLLTIFAVDNTMAYWVLVQPLGFFVAPLWPSMVAWTDHHIELTGNGMSVFLLAAAVGGLCHLRLIGYLYDHFGPRTFLYQTTGYGILALALAIALTLIGSQHGNRFKWNKDKEIEVSDEKHEPMSTKY